MKSILDFIKVFKNIETYKGPGPRNMEMAKAYGIPDAFDPDLEQSEFLRPGETLEDWKPNPFLKPHAEGGRIGLQGGQLVRNTVDGSRPGYRGPRGGDRKLLDQLIEDANKGFKLAKMKDLQVKAGYNRSTNLVGNLDSLETKMKKAFEHVMGDPNKPVSQMFDPMTQVKKLIGTNDSPGRILKGWAPYETDRRLIKNLALPLSKQRLRKTKLTLENLRFRIENNVKEELLYSAPRKVTNETKIFDIVNRHVNQGGKELEWITKPGKTELGYPSYSEAKFKYKGKTYDMAELINNAETDPNFKEFFKAQDDLKKLNGERVIHPKTGNKIRLDKLMQEVYDKKTSYVMDHFGQVGKDPFTKLRIVPARLNAAASTIFQYEKKSITDPAKKAKYSKKGKKQALDKMGYNFNQSIDDLIKAEMKLANDVLVKGRVLKKPNQIVDDIRKRDTIIKDVDKKLNNKGIPTQERFRLETLRKQAYEPDFYSKKAVPGEGFAKQLELGSNTKFNKAFNKTFQDLSPRSIAQLAKTHGCGDFKVGGSIMSCLQGKFKADPEKFLQRSVPLAKDNANLFKWFKNGRKIARGTGVFLAWEAAFAPIIGVWSGLEGESMPRIINDIAYGIPFIGETTKEEWMKYAGGDEKAELAYKMQRMGELETQELPQLEYERDRVINKMAHTPGKSPKQLWIEKDIEEKKLELQALYNTPEFYEGPAGGASAEGDYGYNEPVTQDAYALEQLTTKKIAADKAARKKQRWESFRPWTSQLQMAGGGMVGIRKPNAIAPTGGPMSQGLRSLYINDKDY